MEPVLEEKRALGKDAILEGVALLMTKSAVALVHVDITKQRKSYIPDDDRMRYEDNDQPIGFNDHGGGSESRFKILLNGSPEEFDMQYVLYSPPDKEGNPSNIAFHKADFTFLSWEPKGPYKGVGHVPNPLKTSGAHSYRGASSYQYYIFGGPDVPRQVYEKFSEAGFGFKLEPYTHDISAPEGVMTTFTLSRQEDDAREALGYRGSRFWPGDQFAKNLELLGMEVPKLKVEDYSLVRPENTLVN